MNHMDVTPHTTLRLGDHVNIEYGNVRYLLIKMVGLELTGTTHIQTVLSGGRWASRPNKRSLQVLLGYGEYIITKLPLDNHLMIGQI